jgi:hypothetical protein
VPPKKLLMPPTGGKKPPFGSLTLLPLSVLLVSVRLPPEFETPPTALLNALTPPGALALFPLTVLFVSVTTPVPELRMPPNASLGVPPVLFPLTVLLVSATTPKRLVMPPTAVLEEALATALFPLTVLLVSVRLPPRLKMPPTPLWNWATLALFPLTVLFVRVSAPLLTIPPAELKPPTVPCPSVIVR